MPPILGCEWSGRDNGVVDTQWDEIYDVVVVGAGTGLFAALAAAEAGLRVLLIEKSGSFGGSAAMSAGILWMPCCGEEAETGDTPLRARAYLDSLVGDTAPRERRLSFVEHSPAAVALLRRATHLELMHVPGYPDHHEDFDGASVTGRAIEARPFNMAALGADRKRVRASNVAAPVPMPITSVDYKWLVLLARAPWQALPRAASSLLQGIGGKLIGRDVVAAGRALIAGLLEGIRDAGVETWLESPLVDVVSEHGRITGAVVERGDHRVRVGAARGVILAAGGFENNPVMRRTYQSAALKDGWSFNAEENTGDVITIAQTHGAGLASMDQSWWSPGIPPAKEGGVPTFMLAERSQPGSMIVDATGHRFFNESCDPMTAGQIMLGLQKTDEPRVPAWLIFDQRYRNSHVFGGRFLPGAPLPRSWYRAGIAWRARTIEQLAEDLAMPGLVECVARFNAMAAHGRDDDFGRGEAAHDRYWGDPGNTPNPNLRALARAPFHAVQVVPGDLGTCGGITTDRLARALRDDGSVIDGLYAIGNSAASAFGNTSPHFGATLAEGLTFGWVAAQHAAGGLNVVPR